MGMNGYRLIWIWGLVMLMVACGMDDASQQGDQTRQETLRRVTLTICLQSDITADAGDTTHRAMGDPGTSAFFRFPRYFYVYPVAFTSDAAPDYALGGGRVLPMKDALGNDCNRVDIGDDANQWERYLMTVDPPQTLMDSVYGSKQSIVFKATADITLMRFYVAASWTPLTYRGEELGTGASVLDGDNNEADVLALMFDADDAATQAHLQDIYSSPYNYKPAGAPYGGKYYYTITDLEHGGDITRIIYHVAAKVDVMWNVAKAKQHDLRVTHVEARQLKQKNCLLFRPTENTWTSADDAANYSKVLMDKMDNDVSRQWYGREYYYTIPYGQYFYTHLHLLKYGEAGDGFNVRLKKDLSPPAFSVFTPWLRTDLNITGDMTYSATEIEIDI